MTRISAVAVALGLCLCAATATLSTAANDKPAQKVRFDKPIRVPVGRMPRYVDVGDLTDDGKPDIVVSNRGSRDLSIVISRGDSTFADQRAVTVSTDPGKRPGPVKLIDLDADGKLDLAVLTRGLSNPRNRLIIRQGQGGGGFADGVPMMFDGALRPQSLQAINLNADAKPELIITGEPGAPGTVVFTHRQGAGLLLLPAPGWTPRPSPLRGGLQGYCLVNRKGRAAVDAWTPARGMALREWRGPLLDNTRRSMKWNLPTAKLGITGNTTAITSGSIDGDQTTDFVVAVLTGGPNPAYRVLTILHKPKPTADLIKQAPAMKSLAYLNLIDLNNDKRDELVMIGKPVGEDEFKLIVLHAQQDGTLTDPSMLEIPTGHNGVAFADVTGDGKKDFLLPDLVDHLLIYPNQSDKQDPSKKDPDKKDPDKKDPDKKDPDKKDPDNKDPDKKDPDKKDPDNKDPDKNDPDKDDPDKKDPEKDKEKPRFIPAEGDNVPKRKIPPRPFFE